jgi:poly(3-hydroxybutyrate) depolymerase
VRAGAPRRLLPFKEMIKRTYPPAVGSSAVAGSVDAAFAAAQGWAEYLLSVARRGADPSQVGWELNRWCTTMLDRREPTWSSPHEISWETPIARLRDFSGRSHDHVVPTLVLPPQAGHSSCIVDFSPRQSQMQTIRAAGLTRLYSMDWIGATQATKHSDIEDYLAVIARAVADIGEPVNLVGDCQGGWLATIYAALHPEAVHTLTIAGAPIDFHAGEPIIGGYVELLEPEFYRALVDSGGGVLKGEYLLGGFIAMKPGDEVGRQVALLNHLDDPDHAERYAHFENWFRYTQDLPGDFYLWVVEHLFRDNTLTAGELEIGGHTVHLGRIACPLALLAGATDHITPPPQVFRTAGAVSTPKQDVITRLAAGGHLGLFMGHRSLREHWPPVMAEIYARSRTPAKSRARARRAREATYPGRVPGHPVP